MLLKGLSWALNMPRARRCGPSPESKFRAFFYSTGKNGANYLYLLQRFRVFFFLFSSCVLPEFLSGSAYSQLLLFLLSLLTIGLLFIGHSDC